MYCFPTFPLIAFIMIMMIVCGKNWDVYPYAPPIRVKRVEVWRKVDGDKCFSSFFSPVFLEEVGRRLLLTVKLHQHPEEGGTVL